MLRGVPARFAVVIGSAALLAGCAGQGPMALSDRDCMTRVMYFESNRSSEDGMLAVGTTVMNRLNNPKYPKSVCGVVGQPHQFAPGVLTSPMVPRLAARVARVADRVLAGERHPQVGSAMFFHTAGYSFPYTNMHYVAVAGGNAFYEKVSTPRPTIVAMAEPAFEPKSGFSPVVRAESDETIEQAQSFAPPMRAAPRPRSIDDLLTRSGSGPDVAPRVTTAARFDENGIY
jgi:hypothetical protein